MSKPCKHCSTPFSPVNSVAAYCGPVCAVAAYNVRRKQREKAAMEVYFTRLAARRVSRLRKLIKESE